MVLVDYFLKFLMVRKLPNSTSGAMIKELSVIFYEYGKPYHLRSDYDPYYASEEFKFFL